LIPVGDLRAYLQGRWRIERRIRDRRVGCDGVFRGRARFDAAGAGLAYEETGKLRFGDYEGSARRGGHYRFEAPHKARVAFEHGGLFHDLDLSTGLWRVVHPCGADLYRGRIIALAPDRWAVAWWVSGPRKAQIIRARYCRDA